MPNCFSLTRRSAPEAGSVDLTTIDEEMCDHFGVPCDPLHWHSDWYGLVGFGLAMGRSFNDLRALFAKGLDEAAPSKADLHLLAVVDWLDAEFVSDAWAEVGRGKRK